MAQLNIHLDAVRAAAGQVERLAHRLSQTAQYLSMLRSQLDGSIQSRRDIGRRLQAAELIRSPVTVAGGKTKLDYGLAALSVFG